MLSSPRAAP
jgi:hypothetical protein